MRKTLNIMPYLKIALIISALLLCFKTSTYAEDITLEWDANAEPDLDHYVVYWGTDFDPPYANNNEDEGDFIDNNTTTYTVTGLSDDTVYYFAVKAFDTEGLESNYSNVVSVDIPSGSGGGGGGGCFIATAAFGSNMDRHVKILSEFRDRRLASNPIGRSIIDTYYKFSPPVADYLSKHPSARTVMRYVVVPITSIASISLSIHPLVLLCAFIFLLLTGVYFARRLPRSPNNLAQ
jgi:hypothetical protein